MKTKTVSSSNGGESSSRSAEKRAANEEAEDFTTKPAPAKMSKFGFSIGSQTTKKASAISIKLGANVSLLRAFNFRESEGKGKYFGEASLQKETLNPMRVTWVKFKQTLQGQLVMHV